MAYELQDRLMSMGPEQTQAFHDILHIYEELGCSQHHDGMVF